MLPRSIDFRGPVQVGAVPLLDEEKHEQHRKDDADIDTDENGGSSSVHGLPPAGNNMFPHGKSQAGELWEAEPPLHFCLYTWLPGSYILKGKFVMTG